MTAHFFSVDVEEHFQVSAFEPFVARADWDRHESRVGGNTRRILDLLSAAGATGTFFTLGWVAERCPDLVRDIAAAGHEIASHGWDHRRVTDLEPEAFREQVRRSRRVLQDLSGQPVYGYRAPSYSIVRGREWALDILLAEGYRYDSSLFPIRRPGYGYDHGQSDPFWIERTGGRLLEIPPATLRVFGLRVPAAGGAYFRLFPYGLVASALRSAGRRGAPGAFYVHPWEVDPQQPRVPVNLRTRVRHYGGLERTSVRLKRLLAEFRFTAIADAFALGEGAAAATLPVVSLPA